MTTAVCVCATVRARCVCGVRPRTIELGHRFRSFMKTNEISEILLSKHPTLSLLKLFLCACYGRELWHATNYIKVLGSERRSTNTIWDFYIISSIDLDARGKPSTMFPRGWLVEAADPHVCM